VKAREIVVLGSVHGNVEASDKIDIRKDARLVGDIKTARIVIEDGAYFKGSIDIARPDTTKPAATPAPKPVVSTSSPSNAAAVTAPAGSSFVKRPLENGTRFPAALSTEPGSRVRTPAANPS
jgi:hypothetical protein